MYLFRKTSEGYFFESEQGYSYEVYFVEVPFYFPENPEFKDNVFELVIKLNDTQKTKKPLKDRNVPPTIASIFLDFFSSYDKVVVFSCDTSDSKQSARFRKFNDWYLRFNTNTFIKYDGIVNDFENNMTYYMSLIIKVDNPLKDIIKKAFGELIEAFIEVK